MLPELKIKFGLQFGIFFYIFEYKGSWWTITTNPQFSQKLHETYRLTKL